MFDMKYYIEDNFDEFLKTIRCNEVQRLISFRNHTHKLVDMFNTAGFKKYAAKLKEQAAQELENVELIKSRTSFRDD